MKYDIIVDGNKAEVSIETDGKGAFTGSVTTPKYGLGQITCGRQMGDDLVGNVTMGGYNATFSAKISGNCIAGQLKYGWLFKKSFTGTQAV